MLDALTLHTVMALAQSTMGLFLLTLWLTHREERALLIWAGTNFFCCITMFLFVKQGDWHPFLTIVVASWGFLGFIVGYWVGLRTYFKWRQRWDIIVPLFVVQTFIVCYFSMVESLLWPRFVSNSIVAAILSFFLCRDFLRGWRETRFLSFRLFLILFTCHGLIFLASGINAAFTQPEGGYSDLNSGLSGVAILEALIMFFIASTCVAILVPEKLNAKLKTSAITDPLSNLFNRAHFMEALERTITGVVDPDNVLAVLYIDLDGFKEINDQYGHHVGDRLLIKVSKILQRVTGQTGTVARMGGDEFAIFIEGEDARLQAETLAKAIGSALTQSFDLGQMSVDVNSSIGIAPCTSAGEDGVELVRRADIAMYAAKSKGRGQFVFFSDEMDDELREANWLKVELAKAVTADDITVAFQPKFDVRDPAGPRIASVEALARWTHPERGFISPDKFITAAEDSGQIIDLGRQVLEKACRLAAPWDGVRLSVNLSPKQFSSPDLKADILAIADKAGLTPSRLELEITEGVLLVADERVKTLFSDLQDQGVTLALDDFGTGYSSFSYLRDCNFDTVKIDREFVQAMEEDDQALEVTQAVIRLAKALELTVVAEGVETERQYKQLQAMGCDQIQGYYLSRPLSPDQFSDLLREQQGKVTAFSKSKAS